MINCNNPLIIKKIKSYIGFAKKSGKIKIGTDNILAYKKNSVIILSQSISDNAKNKLNNHSNKTKSKLVCIKKELMNEILDSDSILAVSIVDENLALACLDFIKKLEESIIE